MLSIFATKGGTKKAVDFFFHQLRPFQSNARQKRVFFPGKNHQTFHGGNISFKGPAVGRKVAPSTFHNFFSKKSLEAKDEVEASSPKKNLCKQKVDPHFFRKHGTGKEPPNANGFGCFGVDPFSGEPTGPEPFLLSKPHKDLSKWLPWPLDPDWKSHSLH